MNEELPLNWSIIITTLLSILLEWQFETIIRQADAHAAQSMSKLSKMPKYIFELNYSDDAESKFSAITGEHGILYAFHGSSVENFHSIVHNGLLNMFNKVRSY